MPSLPFSTCIWSDQDSLPHSILQCPPSIRFTNESLLVFSKEVGDDAEAPDQSVLQVSNCGLLGRTLQQLVGQAPPLTRADPKNKCTGAALCAFATHHPKPLPSLSRPSAHLSPTF